MDLIESTKTLTEILGLTYQPIAAKLFEDIVALDGCQVVRRLLCWRFGRR